MNTQQNLQLLLRQRDRITSTLSKTIQRASSPASIEHIEEAEEFLDILSKSWVDLAQVEDQLVFTQNQPPTYQTIENQYINARVNLKSRINSLLQIKPRSSNSTTNYGQTGMHFDQYMNTTTAEIRLPRINISSFDGNYQEWPSFCDIFTTAIHNNNGLTDSHKFQYLKGYLKGDAEALIRHLHVTSENYQTAWNKLKERYDNKKHIISALINLFMDQPSSATSSHGHLRKLCDTTDVRGLQQLGDNATSRNPWLIHLMTRKLDPETKLEWAQQSENNTSPTIEDFIKFLNSRCNILEVCSEGMKRTQNKTGVTIRTHHTTINNKCVYCTSNEHFVSQCTKFHALPINERRAFVSTNNYCFNCIRPGHQCINCICQKHHHTLLHQSSTTSDHEVTELQSLNHTHTQTGKSTTLMATAIVIIKDKFGHPHKCRALLDSGAQSSLITEACVQMLGIPRQHARISVHGLGSTQAGVTRGMVNIQIASLHGDETLLLQPLILSRLTNPIPSCEFDTSNWEYIDRIQLADSTFNQPGRIDLLIGADKFLDVLCTGKAFGPNGCPPAQNTIFGWVLCGELQQMPTITSLSCSLATNAVVDLDQTLRRFWEIEEVSSIHQTCTTYTEEEQQCEDHFTTTHTRDDEGRFIVKLPFKQSHTTLGESFTSARRRFESLERRFQRDENLYKEYSKFITECSKLGHMKLMSKEEVESTHDHQYYLPHHAVIKESSSTTKLRVVFDGSAKTSSGISLNDILMVGPTVQDSLAAILSRFRTHQFVFTADVQKMYRQVRIHEDDTQLQRILWRGADNELLHYKLQTVTYGTSSAPYLATRVLHQLANIHSANYPAAASVLQHDVYVDDLMTGSSNIKQVMTLKHELVLMLQDGGFQLRKWSANHPKLLEDIPQEHREVNPLNLEEDSGAIKILVVQWDPIKDSFSYKVTPSTNKNPTKRSVLSDSAKIFDPIGWLAPVTVKLKIFFQDLWLSELDWDDQLSDNETQVWNSIRNELPLLENIFIPRWISSTNQPIELHGFADASEKAYAAVIYSRCLDDNGKIIVTLISAKTKVSPLKQVSLARLELCAAVLLTRLMKQTVEALALPQVKSYGRTDSTITLAWLSDHPRRWKTFIANRTSEIVNIMPRSQWRHITSSSNPADCASRGIYPTELLHHNLWWNGPSWLSKCTTEWPQQTAFPAHTTDLLEARQPTLQALEVMVTSSRFIIDISSWAKTIRLVALCLRFISNCRQRDKQHRTIGLLSVIERKQATTVILRWTQHNTFAFEINTLTNQECLPKSNRLASLNPFLDADNILRVGGRLKNAILPYNQKHPIILSHRHHITQAIVNEAHLKHLHAGPTLLASILHQTYWITNYKGIIRTTIHKCITCFKQRKATAVQLMGDLPHSRVQLTRPFLRTGVDYAGPFTIKSMKGRGTKTYKGYISLFICLATKAIHLELVGDLTTDSFIAALKRFISRRGLCTDIYSDNGTNFIGANHQISDMYKLITNEQHNEAIHNWLSKDNITWHVIPPAAPHFGGIWEAGVKSVKFHLRRVVGETILTFEEFTTLLAQIEALLNSRSLCKLETGEFDVLTPAHFLVGHPLTVLPEANLDHINITRLSRWQLVQQLIQGFWTRWHTEYLSTLQQRHKWKTQNPQMKKGDLVIIKDDNVPPTKWSRGIIHEVHPGTDNIIRVVSLKTATGIFKRPITKICPLPLE